MRLGVWTPLPHTIRPEPMMEAAVRDAKVRGAGSGGDKAFEFATQVLQTGEKHGFDISLIAARHLGPDLDAWTLASALAAKTETMELMVAVHPGINTPQMVAKMGASLDRISGARLSVNVVNGWNKDEFNIFGNGAWLDSQDDRYQRMDEFIQVMKGLWTEDSFSFKGDFYNVDAGILPLKTRRTTSPPIYTASRSPEGKETIAKYCDHWFVPDLADYRRYDETIALIEREVGEMNDRAAGYGRTIGYGLSAHVICADTVAEAEAQASAMEAHGRTARYNSSTAKALGACLVGPPELIAERIRTYDDLGIGVLMFHFHPMLDGLQTFVERVMPLLDTPTRRSPAGDGLLKAS
jgi:FMNH2-dependent dimethyl sulfone monooxygenase